jgi:hypothetical protein
VTDCPFYGLRLFSLPVDGDAQLLASVKSVKADQCALMTSSFSPCRMAHEGAAPSWARCVRNPEVVEVLGRG